MVGADAERWHRARCGYLQRFIGKASTSEERRTWRQQMQKHGIEPNVVSYTTLVAKTSSEQEARWLFGKMQEAGIEPDVLTYNSVIEKTSAPEEARAWFEHLQRAGIWASWPSTTG